MLSENEFEDAFKTLKRNKTPGHDGLDVNIITSVYEFIKRTTTKDFQRINKSRCFTRKNEINKGNTNLQIWYNKLSANFRTFLFL